MDRLWPAQSISSWFYIFNKSHSLTPSKVWEKKGLGTIIRVFFSFCLSFISTPQNMEVCRRSDVELCWWLPRASNQQATLLPGRRFSWYGSGNQISFSSLISFHMISFHMILTWSIRYHSVRWYHFMRSPLRGRISHLTQSLSGHFIRTARICHWKVSPCLAHQHPPWCHQYHSIPPPVSPSPPSSPRIPRFWASSWSEAARVTLSATTWPPPPPQCGTMWDNVAQSGHHHRHHILLRTSIWSNCHTKRQLSPSWSHLWMWSSILTVYFIE